MTCTEVAKMYEFVKKVIAPVGAAAILAALFYPLCVENGQCDYLKLWIFMGIPFGIHRMFLWIIPKGFDIGGTVGMFVFNLLVGGVIGGFVLAWRLLMAVCYLVKTVIAEISRIVRAKAM
ncbi:Uncharacterised protein [uncultured Roseburia sp.]|nr:Uncharacterised protein [uncultured Roseburia sp.]